MSLKPTDTHHMVTCGRGCCSWLLLIRVVYYCGFHVSIKQTCVFLKHYIKDAPSRLLVSLVFCRVVVVDFLLRFHVG